MLSRDQIAFMGKVAEWLESAPTMKPGYGEFYVSTVKLSFDGDPIGHFISDDPDWYFVEEKTT